MPKVLIITYYWPPAGGGGVQRWLKFVKYLPEYGWDPIVYAPENADYPLVDKSLMREVRDDIEVVRRPIREVRRAFIKILNLARRTATREEMDQLFYKDAGSRSYIERLGLWIRSNFFIPDARVSWVRPSVRYLSRLLPGSGIDTVVSTGPPHSMHLIALGLKRKFPHLRWVADFRDPWTEIEYFGQLKLTPPAVARHRRLEREVLSTADEVVTVSPAWAGMLGSKVSREVVTITNGFDAQDFTGPAPALDDALTLCHTGTMALDRNPTDLWKKLSDLPVHLRQRLIIKFVGSTDREVKDDLSRIGLQYRDLGYVDHQTAIHEIRASHVLLLVLNMTATLNMQGRIPGKLFEYLASGRPILAVCPEESDTARILRRFGHLILTPHMTPTELGNFLERAPQFQATGDIRDFSRRSLTSQVVAVLEGDEKRSSHY